MASNLYIKNRRLFGLNMKFKAIIFDLDGTLLNSISGLAEAMNLMLTKQGYPTHPVEKYKSFVGKGIKETIRNALPEGVRKTCAIDALIADYRSEYDFIWPKKTIPYDGITDLLGRLQKDKIKTAVLSNKSDDFSKRMATTLLPHHRFETVLGDRPGIPRKPDPTTALAIAGELRISPGETAFIGDSGVDMETGRRAGMYPVGVLWGFREAEELIDCGAKKLIRHPLELLDINHL
jgi:phosphoglycolate phosphatase